MIYGTTNSMAHVNMSTQPHQPPQQRFNMMDQQVLTNKINTNPSFMIDTSANNTNCSTMLSSNKMNAMMNQQQQVGSNLINNNYNSGFNMSSNAGNNVNMNSYGAPPPPPHPPHSQMYMNSNGLNNNMSANVMMPHNNMIYSNGVDQNEYFNDVSMQKYAFYVYFCDFMIFYYKI